MSQPRRYRRRSARVLLVDGTGRVLLLRFLRNANDPDGGHDWITPGGGVGKGEPLARAAARELREEVGLVVPAEALGGPVAYCGGYADLRWARGHFRDDFFFHRVDAHEVDVSRMEAFERRHHAGHRWWTCAELVSTADPVYPLGLVPLLTDLLAGRVPEQPLELPWHH